MSKSQIQYLINGRRVPWFSNPELVSSEHPWDGFTFEEAAGPTEPLPKHSYLKTTLFYVCPFEGEAAVHWKYQGTWNHDNVRAGSVSIVRRDVEMQSAVLTAIVPTMVLQIDNQKVLRFAPERNLAIDDFLVPVAHTDDARLAHLMAAMRAEVAEGCLSGRLYAESISIALLAYLATRYSVTARTSNQLGAFSESQARKVKSHIEDNLVDNISVAGLAAVVGMSPSHFSRVFKSTFGESPYRFVMRQRVDAAKILLAEGSLSATHIAASPGFASQSHFLKVFRQFVGVTPHAFRARCVDRAN